MPGMLQWMSLRALFQSFTGQHSPHRVRGPQHLPPGSLNCHTKLPLDTTQQKITALVEL
jgi:hypothetical protein